MALHSTPASRDGSAEAAYVAWMRERQQRLHRHQPVIAQRQARPDSSEAADVRAQEIAWAQRHAHERRLQASAMAQLRHRL
jgi:hypothetical protein